MYVRPKLTFVSLFFCFFLEKQVRHNFTYKADLNEYTRDGNTPNKVNYVSKTGTGKDTKFKGYRTGPYYSGLLVVTHPEDVKEMF